MRAAHRRDRGTTVASERGPLFIQVFNPPLRLLVVGAVHISSGVGADGEPRRLRCQRVVDPRRAFASDARFPGVDVRQDWPDEALEALKPTRAPPW